VQPFVYQCVSLVQEAVAAGAREGASLRPGAIQYLAGGTSLLDLMKLEVVQPARIIDINPLAAGPLGRIKVDHKGLRLGSLVRMAEVAEHPHIVRYYPVIAQSLRLAASQQVRNMASLAGNVLQRTRCPYFRDVTYPECNKRNPGSGCSAMNGFNRLHAVLGVSKHCIATYAGDFAQALIALDATVDLLGPHGLRTIPIAALHRRPGSSPDRETTLAPGELIVSFFVPAGPWTRRSLYLKVRDRESFAFALVSVAVALDLRKGRVRDARIALGGVATVPWRTQGAEAALEGKALNAETAKAASAAAFSGARRQEHNAFKIALGKRTLFRALTQAAALKI
jgi:xanthine dehydrogenase YagS FAD-binding subunit